MLRGAHTLHSISKALLVFIAIAVVEDHDVLASSAGFYGEADRFVGRIFTACLNFFEMGKMGSGARNLKFFWHRHGIWLFFFG